MLPPRDLSRLSDTLFELHDIHDKGHEEYCSIALSSPIDKMWNWFNGLVGIKTGLLEQKAHDTLVKTKQEFLRVLDEQKLFETTLHLPQHLRASKCLIDSERSLLDVGTHCLFLSTHTMMLNPARAVGGLQKLWQEKMQVPFLDASYMHTLERFTKRYTMVLLAALLESPYPIGCFSKIIQNQKLDSGEFTHLRKWTKQIDKNKNHLAVHMLHTALTAVVEGMAEAGDVAKNVALLEWRLYFGLCDLFGEDDHIYLQWVNTAIVPGARLQLVEGQVLVGSAFALSLPRGMNASLYELPEDPSSLLFVGCNPAVLGIWQINAERCARGCKPVQVKQSDPLMRYFVIEALSLAFVDIQWCSDSCELHQRDVPYLEQIARLLAWLAFKVAETPRNLRVDYLYFMQEAQGVVLRALMPFDDAGPYNFIAIEQFAKECAKGNRWCLRYLMQASGLNQHPLPVYVRGVIREALLDQDPGVTVQNKLNRPGVTDPQYIDQIDALVKVLQELRDKSVRTLLPRLKVPTLEPKLKEGLAEALVIHQQESCFSSALEPSLLEPSGLEAFERAFIAANPALF